MPSKHSINREDLAPSSKVLAYIFVSDSDESEASAPTASTNNDDVTSINTVDDDAPVNQPHVRDNDVTLESDRWFQKFQHLKGNPHLVIRTTKDTPFYQNPKSHTLQHGHTRFGVMHHTNHNNNSNSISGYISAYPGYHTLPFNTHSFQQPKAPSQDEFKGAPLVIFNVDQSHYKSQQPRLVASNIRHFASFAALLRALPDAGVTAQATSHTPPTVHLQYTWRPWQP